MLKLPNLIFPKFSPKIKIEDNNTLIFDIFRKKWVKLSPEEWVRQNILNYLAVHLKYPVGRIGIEFQIKYGNLSRRPDAVVFDEQNKALVIIECKAPSIEINEDVFFQACMYNKQLQAPYFILSNGINNIISKINNKNNDIIFIKDIPLYDDIKNHHL